MFEIAEPFPAMSAKVERPETLRELRFEVPETLTELRFEIPKTLRVAGPKIVEEFAKRVVTFKVSIFAVPRT
jgi:hypothetical protein